VPTRRDIRHHPAHPIGEIELAGDQPLGRGTGGVRLRQGGEMLGKGRELEHQAARTARLREGGVTHGRAVRNFP
jgi:hypothetical protein